MGDGGRRHAHVLADDDGAGARVDDDLGHRLAALHFEIFQHRHVVDPLARIERRADPHRAAVDGLGHAGAEQVVDAVDDVLGGGEIRTVEVEGQAVALVEAARHRALHRGAGRHAAGGRHVDGDFRTVAALGIEAADDEVALGDGVGLAVDTLQLGHQQAAAAQALGVADGGNGDVDGLAGLGERRQVGVHGDRGDVLQLHVAHVRRHLDAELRQHVVEGLQGERRLRGLVAGAVEADHQAVADQLVVAHALDGGDVLQAFGLGGQAQQCTEQNHVGAGHARDPANTENFAGMARSYSDHRPHYPAQNGHIGLRKNRSSQPGWLASAKAPVPE
ncbi:hypothetical protein D9M71_296430 [compost metagenome]